MPELIFVYNADSGLFNALADWAHKIFAPHTYACRLCAVTYDNLGMKRRWRDFVAGLGVPVVFLHRDELLARYGVHGEALPAVFSRTPHGVQVWLSAEAMNACHTLDDLMHAVRQRLETSPHAEP